MMNSVNRDELYSRLKKQAYNSSHYVWLWSDLNFFESSNGWIFGVTKELGVNLVALEPLPPIDNNASDEKSFTIALEDLKSHFQGGPIAFVGIYTPFAKTLADFGFSSFQIGKEPWVNLSDIKPTGHAGRKVRVGRNQALKSGLRVEEWNLIEVIQNPAKLNSLNEVKKLWEDQSFVSLSGFLHGMTFENIPQDRKCFVALTQENEVDGILIVTPIVSEKSWYFEDMLIRTSAEATRGIGELLTLSAMEKLQELGFAEISLGIVPMTSVGISDFGEAPPTNFLRLTKFFQSSLGLFYNAEGMELFRKRFKVVKWDKIYLSVLTDKQSAMPASLQWVNVLLSITAAYKPSLQLKPKYIAEKVISPVKRYPTTFTFILFSTISFLLNTKFSAIANFISQNLIFSLNTELWQWPYRTLVSELIYSSPLQFGVLASSITLVLFKIEKEVYDKKWVSYVLGLFVLSDIIVRIASELVYKKIYTYEPLLNMILLFPSNGGGIILSALLGFAVMFSGQKKDEAFAIGLLAFIALSFILPSFGIAALAILYSTTFYIGGYLLGKKYLSYQSQKDALINKSKNDDDEALEINPAKESAKAQTSKQKNTQRKVNQNQCSEPKSDLMEDELVAKNA